MAIYEPRVTEKANSLLSRIAAQAGTPMNMTDYIMFFGFDVMGDVGKSFSCPPSMPILFSAAKKLL